MWVDVDIACVRLAGCPAWGLWGVFIFIFNLSFRFTHRRNIKYYRSLQVVFTYKNRPPVMHLLFLHRSYRIRNVSRRLHLGFRSPPSLSLSIPFRTQDPHLQVTVRYDMISDCMLNQVLAIDISPRFHTCSHARRTHSDPSIYPRTSSSLEAKK